MNWRDLNKRVDILPRGLWVECPDSRPSLFYAYVSGRVMDYIHSRINYVPPIVIEMTMVYFVCVLSFLIVYITQSVKIFV